MLSRPTRDHLSIRRRSSATTGRAQPLVAPAHRDGVCRPPGIRLGARDVACGMRGTGRAAQGNAGVCGEALARADAGSVGWLFPVDPLLQVTAHHEAWAQTLAILREPPPETQPSNLSRSYFGSWVSCGNTSAGSTVAAGESGRVMRSRPLPLPGSREAGSRLQPALAPVAPDLDRPRAAPGRLASTAYSWACNSLSFAPSRAPQCPACPVGHVPT